MTDKRKPGRPKGTHKRTKQAITVMLRIEDIIAKGGIEASREKIKNNFSKL